MRHPQSLHLPQLPQPRRLTELNHRHRRNNRLHICAPRIIRIRTITTNNNSSQRIRNHQVRLIKRMGLRPFHSNMTPSWLPAVLIRLCQIRCTSISSTCTPPLVGRRFNFPNRPKYLSLSYRIMQTRQLPQYHTLFTPRSKDLHAILAVPNLKPILRRHNRSRHSHSLAFFTTRYSINITVSPYLSSLQVLQPQQLQFSSLKPQCLLTSPRHIQASNCCQTCTL